MGLKWPFVPQSETRETHFRVYGCPMELTPVY